MRAAVYARVSSAGQRDSHTIESQLRVLPAYAKQHGWTVVGTYIDDGKSAATGKLDARDGFHRMVADADRKLFDVVLVVDVDRLTRTNSMEERAAILGPFQRNGIDIVTPHGGRLDLGTFLGEFFITMQAIVAAEERRKILARTKAGADRTLAEGLKARGRTPYGYHYDLETKTWSVNESAAAIVRDIFAMIRSGRSCQDIALELEGRNAQPAPPRVGWNRVAVYRIVRKTTVAGEWIGDRHKRLKVKLPPIITEAEWHEANRIMAAGQRRGLRKTRHVYLLEGLAACGECGEPMYIRSTVKMRSGNMAEPRYVCRVCKVFWRTAEVDARVWEVVERTLRDPDLATEIDRRASIRKDNASSWACDAAKYEDRLSRMAKAESALLARFSKGAISEAALDTELARMSKERGALLEQLEAARSASASPPEVDAKSLAEKLRGLADANDPTKQREVVRFLVAKAAIHRDGRVPITLEVDTPAATSLVLRSACRKHHVIRLVKVA